MRRYTFAPPQISYAQLFEEDEFVKVLQEGRNNLIRPLGHLLQAEDSCRRVRLQISAMQ